MPTHRVQAPDGSIIRVEAPEGASQDEIMAFAQANWKPKPGRQPDALDKIDPTEGMSTYEKFMAGVGSAMTSTARGLGQLVPGLVSQESIKEQERMDRPLANTTAGSLGQLTGTLVPALALPGSTLPRALAAGAAYGLSAPVGEGDVTSGKLLGAAGGTIGGGVGYGVAKGIGRLITPVQTAPKGAQADLVRQAQNLGIDLPASVKTGNPRLGYIESTLATMPGGKSMEQLYRKPLEQQAQAVMREAGGSGLATSANLEAAKKGSQAVYKDIASRTMVNADDTLLTDLGAAQQWANQFAPDKAKPVANVINTILNKVDDAGQIPGAEYQALRGVIRRATPGDAQTAAPFNMAKKAIDDAFARSVGVDDAMLKKATDRQYAVMKSIEPLIPAAEARGGTFTPSGLLGPLGNFGGDAGMLAKIGPLLREPPQSGTMPRLYYSGGLGLLGGAATAASGGDWSDVARNTGMMIAAPYAANKLLATKPVQGYLSQGFAKLEKQVAVEAIKNRLPAAASALPYWAQQ